jgi:hypothetical protein
MTMTYEKTVRFLVAIRGDGKFFGLDESSPWVTTPFWCDFPGDAKRIVPHESGPIKHATYYFEHSGRMREWLSGCRMVGITLVSTAGVTPWHGP